MNHIFGIYCHCLFMWTLKRKYEVENHNLTLCGGVNQSARKSPGEKERELSEIGLGITHEKWRDPGGRRSLSTSYLTSNPAYLWPELIFLTRWTQSIWKRKRNSTWQHAAQMDYPTSWILESPTLSPTSHQVNQIIW